MLRVFEFMRDLVAYRETAWYDTDGTGTCALSKSVICDIVDYLAVV